MFPIFTLSSVRRDVCRTATCCCRACLKEKTVGGWICVAPESALSRAEKIVLSHCPSLSPWAVMQLRVSEVTVPSQHNQFKSAPRKQIQIRKPDSTQSKFPRKKSWNKHLTRVFSSILNSPGAYSQSPV